MSREESLTLVLPTLPVSAVVKLACLPMVEEYFESLPSVEEYFDESDPRSPFPMI